MRTIALGRAAAGELRGTIAAADRAIMARVSAANSPLLDRAMPALSRAANYSRLWMGIAAALAASESKWGRRAGLRGPGSVPHGRVGVLRRAPGHRPVRRAGAELQDHAGPGRRHIGREHRGHELRGHRPHHRLAASADPGHAAGSADHRFHDRACAVGTGEGLGSSALWLTAGARVARLRGCVVLCALWCGLRAAIMIDGAGRDKDTVSSLSGGENFSATWLRSN